MEQQIATFAVKKGLAQMLKGGVIMDVVTAEHARIAEDAGAVAVMALERVPADIRAHGGVARMSDPGLIEEIMRTVTIPVMAKVRIGHFVEAQVLEALGVDYIDESEVLTPADEEHHIDKHQFKVPFVCGCRDLPEALRRIGEGAAMIRTKGEAGTGNIVEAVRHIRAVQAGIRELVGLRADELFAKAKELSAPLELVQHVPLFGRCAGMIVLSKRIAGGEEPVLPLLDVTVVRNAFGRQLGSFEGEVVVPVLGDTPVHGVFIRAPVIDDVGPGVDVLARLEDGRIVAVRERNVLATAFHPELAGETRFHRLLATMAEAHREPDEGASTGRAEAARGRRGF